MGSNPFIDGVKAQKQKSKEYSDSDANVVESDEPFYAPTFILPSIDKLIHLGANWASVITELNHQSVKLDHPDDYRKACKDLAAYMVEIESAYDNG